MRTAAEIVDAWVVEMVSPHPKPILTMIIEDLINDALKELQPKIHAMVDEALAQDKQGHIVWTFDGGVMIGKPR